jgi:hypothetical protein
MGIVECLNKVPADRCLCPISAAQVRECQVTIQSNQDVAIEQQRTTNRLLGNAVEKLEETIQCTQDTTGPEGEKGDRLSGLCHELAGSLTGLMAAQDEMGRRDQEHVEALDRLVRSAAGLVSAQQEGRASPARKRGTDLLARGGAEVAARSQLAAVHEGSVQATGEPGKRPAGAHRLPVVRVERQPLSASQRAQLKDEFASPEKAGSDELMEEGSV